MSSHSPTIGPFCISEPDKWKLYELQFTNFLVAEKIDGDERKRACFLAHCGLPTLELAVNLLLPQDIATVSLRDILETLRSHFKPTVSIFPARLAFHRRDQQPGESVADYAAALRLAAAPCQWRDLEEALRDRLLLGLKDEAAQRRLLKRDTLSFAEVLKEALASEAADSGVKLFHQKAVGASARESAVQKQESPDSPTESSDSEEDVGKVQRKGGKGTKESIGPCEGCGNRHLRAKCPFKNAECHSCGKRGHIAKVCRLRPEGRKVAKNRQWRDQPISKVTAACQGRSVVQATTERFFVDLFIQETPVKMEIDSGTSYSIVSQKEFLKIPPATRPRLRALKVSLRDVQGRHIPVLGIGTFNVKFKALSAKLPLVVVKQGRNNLLGVQWFEPLGISFSGIHAVETDPILDVCEKFSEVFQPGLGTFTGQPIAFELDPGVQPIRLKPRRVPFALKERIEAELDRLVAQRVLEPIDSAPWETPIVTVLKANGDIRICADYKCTINKAIRANAYPVPVVSHLLASLHGGKCFAKLDLAQAYQQLPVTPEAALCQAIVTHKGAFRVNRLQFGVNAAPGIFQAMVERLLKGLKGVLPYFDDVLIAADNKRELADKLGEVLKRFQDAGLRVKKEKCVLYTKEVEFLGFKVTSEGIRPSESKVRAIWEAPRPTSKTELQAFLGLLNFYHSFLPQKAALAEPLHYLLKKQTVWNWGPRQEEAFKKVKSLLTSEAVLTHFDPRKPLVLVCDASPVGVGAVLCHDLGNGKEAPIAFYSRSLTKAEKNYAQIDREALAIIAGTKKFHDFIYGRKFTIVTDHKPLLGIFVQGKQTPQILSPRMLRWAMFLQAYDFSLMHRPGVAISHADALSRSPVPAEEPGEPGHQVLLIEALPSPPVTAVDIARETGKDPVLARLRGWVQKGWPARPIAEEFKVYHLKRNELSLERGCLLWGQRVVIPEVLRKRVLRTLHISHPGIVKSKALARSYFWWPRLDIDVEKWIGRCAECQASRPEETQLPHREWDAARGPWSRVHVDFAGPFKGAMFLLAVDAYSKWLEVIPVAGTTSAITIRKLRRLFSSQGLPDVLVTDNAATFMSAEFQDFLRRNAIRHVTSAPFHPATNGQVERQVRTTKEALKRMGPGDLELHLCQFLLTYRVTPLASGQSPAELLMRRKPVTLLDRLDPGRMEDRGTNIGVASPKRFSVGQPVHCRNYAPGPAWTEGSVLEQTGPVSYRVETDRGQVWRRHADQLRHRVSGENLGQNDGQNSELGGGSEQEEEPVENHQQEQPNQEQPEAAVPAREELVLPVAEPREVVDSPRRSKRERGPPKHWKDYFAL